LLDERTLRLLYPDRVLDIDADGSEKSWSLRALGAAPPEG
jgi:hypothetical protein